MLSGYYARLSTHEKLLLAEAFKNSVFSRLITEEIKSHEEMMLSLNHSDPAALGSSYQKIGIARGVWLNLKEVKELLDNISL